MIDMTENHLLGKSKNISVWKRIKDKLKHGLILQVIRNQLAKIGIEITPYFWEREALGNDKPPEIKGDIKEYKLEYLGVDDMQYISDNARGNRKEILLDHLNEGKKCLGLKHHEEIVAFMWIDFKECDFRPNKHRLKSNEAYLSSMYTMESYRGMNIAPYLRYKCYGILNEMGIDTLYSVSEFFNSAAIKYKRKLGVKHQKLILFIGLFKKVRLSFTLKNYLK